MINAVFAWHRAVKGDFAWHSSIFRTGEAAIQATWKAQEGGTLGSLNRGKAGVKKSNQHSCWH